jgi:acetoin utilization protein AcuC
VTAAFIYNEELTRNILREDHVLRPMRLRLVYELLQAFRVFEAPDTRLLAPRIATPQEIGTFHSQDYIEAVESFSKGEELERQHRYGFSDWGDNPISNGMYEAAALATGASLVAADALIENEVDVAFNAGGGYHHAGPDFASGFCIFNDAVVAIQRLLDRGDMGRIAYIDIDAHHGDGVQNAFASTDRVLTISLHETGQYLFPGTGGVEEMGTGSGEGFSVNVPLAPMTNDRIYLDVFRQIVPPLVRTFEPDVLVTQLGIDSHQDDPLTHLMLSSAGHTALIQEFKSLSPGRWLALGGGGYDMSAVARCWALDFAAMAGVADQLPDEIPASFRNQYGITRLRDSATSTDETSEAATAAGEVVGQVQERFFRRFGL